MIINSNVTKHKLVWGLVEKVSNPMPLLNVISTIWKSRVHIINAYDDGYCFMWNERLFSFWLVSYTCNDKDIDFDIILVEFFTTGERAFETPFRDIKEWNCTVYHSQNNEDVDIEGIKSFFKDNAFFTEFFPKENLITDDELHKMLENIGVKLLPEGR